jgi:hypothetical protein
MNSGMEKEKVNRYWLIGNVKCEIQKYTGEVTERKESLGRMWKNCGWE